MSLNREVYREHTELKGLIRKSELTIKEVAYKLGELPSNLSSRLNGYMKLTSEMRDQIEMICSQSAGRMFK